MLRKKEISSTSSFQLLSQIVNDSLYSSTANSFQVYLQYYLFFNLIVASLFNFASHNLDDNLPGISSNCVPLSAFFPRAKEDRFHVRCTILRSFFIFAPAAPRPRQ
jgi:hypothetical protein